MFVTDFTLKDGLLRAAVAMNYEETTLQIITVEASDGRNRTTKTVHIDILPVNEFAPAFKLNNSVWHVTENTPRNICVPVGLFYNTPC